MSQIPSTIPQTALATLAPLREEAAHKLQQAAEHIIPKAIPTPKITVNENVWVAPASMALDPSVRTLIIDREKLIQQKDARINGLAGLGTLVSSLAIGGGHVFTNFWNVLITGGVTSFFWYQALKNMDKLHNLNKSSDRMAEEEQQQKQMQQQYLQHMQQQQQQGREG
jgi:hypothetical protein